MNYFEREEEINAPRYGLLRFVTFLQNKKGHAAKVTKIVVTLH